MSKHRTTRGLLGLAVLVILFLCLPANALAQEECDAQVEAEFESTHKGMEVTVFQFAVDVDVDNDCARVQYDLIIEELLPNGHTKKIRKPGFAKLNDGSFAEVVQHRMSADFEMLGFEARIVSCEVCTIMP